MERRKCFSCAPATRPAARWRKASCASMPARLQRFSAGLEPSAINPLTVQVMEEAGVDMSEHYGKGLKQYLGRAFQLHDHRV